MGVMFFLSLPFMGVMLFPNFVLRNASRRKRCIFSTAFSIFSSSFSFSSFSFSSFFSFSFFFSLSLPLFLFSSPFLLLFLLPPILVRTLFFFFEGTACTVYFRDVRDDTVDCNQVYLHWNKENFSFLAHEFVYFDVNNFLIRSLAKLFVFLLPRCPPTSDS